MRARLDRFIAPDLHHTNRIAASDKAKRVICCPSMFSFSAGGDTRGPCPAKRRRSYRVRCCHLGAHIWRRAPRHAPESSQRKRGVLRSGNGTSLVVWPFSAATDSTGQRHPFAMTLSPLTIRQSAGTLRPPVARQDRRGTSEVVGTSIRLLAHGGNCRVGHETTEARNNNILWTSSPKKFIKALITTIVSSTDAVVKRPEKKERIDAVAAKPLVGCRNCSTSSSGSGAARACGQPVGPWSFSRSKGFGGSQLHGR